MPPRFAPCALRCAALALAALPACRSVSTVRATTCPTPSSSRAPLPPPAAAPLAPSPLALRFEPAPANQWVTWRVRNTGTVAVESSAAPLFERLTGFLERRFDATHWRAVPLFGACGDQFVGLGAAAPLAPGADVTTPLVGNSGTRFENLSVADNVLPAGHYRLVVRFREATHPAARWRAVTDFDVVVLDARQADALFDVLTASAAQRCERPFDYAIAMYAMGAPPERLGRLLELRPRDFDTGLMLGRTASQFVELHAGLVAALGRYADDVAEPTLGLAAGVVQGSWIPAHDGPLRGAAEARLADEIQERTPPRPILPAVIDALGHTSNWEVSTILERLAEPRTPDELRAFARLFRYRPVDALGEDAGRTAATFRRLARAAREPALREALRERADVIRRELRERLAMDQHQLRVAVGAPERDDWFHGMGGEGLEEESFTTGMLSEPCASIQRRMPWAWRSLIFDQESPLRRVIAHPTRIEPDEVLPPE